MKPSDIVITEELAAGPAGRLVETIVARFRLGPHGPFSVRIPKESFSATELRRQVDELCRTIGEVVG